MVSLSLVSSAQSWLLKERKSEGIKAFNQVEVIPYKLNFIKIQDVENSTKSIISDSKIQLENIFSIIDTIKITDKNKGPEIQKIIQEYNSKIKHLVNASKKDSSIIDSLRIVILKSKTKLTLDDLSNKMTETQNGIIKEKKYAVSLNEEYKRIKLSHKGETAENIFKKDTLIIKLYEKNKEFLDSISSLSSQINNLKILTESTSIFNWKKNEDYDLKMKFKKIEFENESNKIIGKVKELEKFRKENQEDIISKILEIKPPIKEDQIYALPEITNTLGNSVVLPSFNLMAFQNFKEGETYGSIKMFSTSLSESGKLDKRTLIIPESSIFGIDFDIIKPFSILEKTKENALRVNANFLSKGITTISNKKDTSSFNFNVFTFKLGVERILFTNIVSTYVEYNFQKSLTNIGMLERKFSDAENLHKKGLSYFNGGFRFKLKPKQGAFGEKNILDFLTFDLGFIITNDKMTFLNDSKDKVIPVLKTGIKF